jgi:O-antigen/teichoic acid export membrane protein
MTEKTGVTASPLSPPPLADASPQRAGLRRKMALGSVAGMGANVLYLGTRLAVTPFILAHVSLGEYGLWSVCFIIMSYAGLSAFGVANVYVKYTAEYTASGRMRELNRLLSTGLTAVGGLSLVILAGLWVATRGVLSLFTIAADVMANAEFVLLGTAVVFLADLTLGVFRSALEGVQEVALARLIWVAASMLDIAALLVLLPLGFGVKGLMYAYGAKTLAENAAYAVFAFRRIPGLGLRVPFLDRDSLPAVFVFGGKVQILGLLQLVISSFDRLLVSGMLGLSATGLFEVGRKLPFTARSVTGAAFAPILPAASALGAVWRDSPRLSPRVRAARYARLTLAAGLAGAMVFLPRLAMGWADDGFVPASPWLGGLLACLLALAWPGLPLAAWLAGLLRGGEYVQGRDLAELYLASSRHIAMINAVIYFFMLAAARPLLLAWVGPGFDKAVTVMLLVAGASLIHLATGTASAIFRGVDRSGRELEYTIIHLVLVLIWTPAMAMEHGLAGAAAGASGAAAAASVYFLARTNQALRISTREYLARVVRPALAPLAAAVPVALGLRLAPQTGRWETLFMVGIVGTAYLVLSVWLLKAWFLTSREWAPAARLLRAAGLGFRATRTPGSSGSRDR